MPEQVISPAVPVSIPSGGDNEFFAPQMLEKLNEAFAQAKPDEFKAPAKLDAKSSSEKTPASAVDLPTGELAGEVKDKSTAMPAEVKPPARAAQWKEVNEERTRLKEENAKFKADLEKYTKEQEKWKTWETERTEFDKIRGHNAELLARLEAAALERSPRFENHFKAKTDTAIALAKQAVGDSHAERVSKLLQLPDSEFRTQALDEIRNELSGTRAGRLDAAIVRMDEINLERSNALANSKANWQATIEAENADKQRKAQELHQTFENRLKAWSDPEKGLALFQKKDGDVEHNTEVDKRMEKARAILNMNVDADEFSKAVLWASAAPGLLQDLLSSREREKQLTTELEALKAGGPELQGGGEEQPVDDEKQYEGMSMGEIIALKVQKAGGYQ